MANVYVPIVFKHIIDALANPDIAASAFLATPVALVCGYGIARLSSALFNELRNLVFSRV
jgi:ATP-binding cassette subfamily B protein